MQRSRIVALKSELFTPARLAIDSGDGFDGLVVDAAQLDPRPPVALRWR
jgi:hypothetical protein